MKAAPHTCHLVGPVRFALAPCADVVARSVVEKEVVAGTGALGWLSYNTCKGVADMFLTFEGPRRPFSGARFPKPW